MTESNRVYYRFFKRIISCLKNEQKKGTLDLDKFDEEFSKCLELQIIANVKCEKNKDGVCYHSATNIVFDYTNPFAYAIGKLENDKVIKLTYKDIIICVSNGWVYDDTILDEEVRKDIGGNEEMEKYAKSKI